ncbi:uncharacterized protein PRCAT00003603001 [Priceomyces carsonii]|uniref:uncharacterized protein n=1 Tax=Priceomyces carsonii TaxID=28549 RepID=UPI002ED7DBDE|nr:unnamed protein product [Priceomyces carsonii]
MLPLRMLTLPSACMRQCSYPLGKYFASCQIRPLVAYSLKYLTRLKSGILKQNEVARGIYNINATSQAMWLSTSRPNNNDSSESIQSLRIRKPSTVRKDVLKLLKLAKPEYKLLAFALVCLVITSAVGMSLPLLIGKILDTVNSTPQTIQADDLPHEKVVDTSRILGLDPSVFYTGLCVFFVVGSVANFGRVYLLRSVGERLVARLRSRLFLKILAQDSYFFDIGPTKEGMKTGDLISRITSDTQIISRTLSNNISEGARSFINGIVGLSMMYFVSWKLTLCMSLIFPPLVLMSFFYGRKIKGLSRKIQENLGEITKFSEEKLNGLKTIQSFAQQRLVIHDYNKEIKRIFANSLREGKLSGVFYGINGFLGNITLIGLLIIGTRFITEGGLSVGDLSSFMMYAVYTGSSVFGLGNFYTELMKGIGASERVFELLELKPHITKSSGKKVDALRGDIKFDNVRFSYPSRSFTEVLRGLNLVIPQGANVCFVGPSGSGKSTIAHLLLRFYDPISGSITIGGENIRELNVNNYRSKLGYVQQEPLLFAGTIRSNILFGKKSASEQEILGATDLSNATDFIKNMPEGLDTKIGPSTGTQLSGGQKQRISLARTLIERPNILILDEATSALDSISEEVVMRNIKKLCEHDNTTIISIAHRLSTIKNSERIIVLNNIGEVVEDGKFDHLYLLNDSQLNKLLQSDLE